MNISKNLDWGAWLYGLFAATIGGGASSVAAGVSISTVGGQDFALGTKKSLQVMIMTFTLSAVTNFFAYLKQQPVPPCKQ